MINRNKKYIHYIIICNIVKKMKYVFFSMFYFLVCNVRIMSFILLVIKSCIVFSEIHHTTQCAQPISLNKDAHFHLQESVSFHFMRYISTPKQYGQPIVISLFYLCYIFVLSVKKRGYCQRDMAAGHTMINGFS